MRDEDRLIPSSVVAQRVGIGRKAMARWKILGKFPHGKKIGPGEYYLESEVDAWIAENKKDPA
jgi:predicted DNA-binding transcriptional regulator AlpA